MSLHLQHLDTLDDGGARVVNAVDHRLYGERILLVTTMRQYTLVYSSDMLALSWIILYCFYECCANND